MHSIQVLRGLQQIKLEAQHSSIPTPVPVPAPAQTHTAQQLKETKKAKADAWKKLIPVAYEISELRQSGEKPFETEEVNILPHLMLFYFNLHMILLACYRLHALVSSFFSMLYHVNLV